MSRAQTPLAFALAFTNDFFASSKQEAYARLFEGNFTTTGLCRQLTN
jgi:hypothetical protein